MHVFPCICMYFRVFPCIFAIINSNNIHKVKSKDKPGFWTHVYIKIFAIKYTNRNKLITKQNKKKKKKMYIKLKVYDNAARDPAIVVMAFG